jgi:multidrug efflux pump
MVPYANFNLLKFVGMLAASTIGILLIPMLYVAFQTLRERARRKPQGVSMPQVKAAE